MIRSLTARVVAPKTRWRPFSRASTRSASSSAGSAIFFAAAISLALAASPGVGAGALLRLERVERVALLAEASLLAAWLARLGPTGRPLREGRTGALVRYGVAGCGVVVPLVLSAVRPVVPRRGVRGLTVASSLFVLAGGIALRAAVVLGGRASADDPQATFDLTRIDGPSLFQAERS